MVQFARERDGLTDAEVEVTPEMIEEGVAELREKPFGSSLNDVVEAVYLAMEVVRRERSRN